MRSPDRPRVLHVLGALNRGGIETWLMHVLRNSTGSWSNDFLLHRHDEGAYDREARALGARLRGGPNPRKPAAYMRALQNILRTEGPYDVVHSHVHFYSGVVLRAAALAGVPVRIAQSHTTEPPRTRAYGALMRHWIQRYATHCLGISAAAAEVLFGARWRLDPRVRIHESAVDFRPYAELPGRAAAKHALGLSAKRTVIGHVGRFAKPKNHAFLVSVFAELRKLGVDAHLLLVGSGPLEGDIRGQVAACGLTAHCTFAGAHDDVRRFYAAFDLIVFPSLWEGFSLVSLEAQAAGVPVLASEAVPAEASVVPGLMHYASLAQGAASWAGTVQRLLSGSVQRERRWSAALMSRTRFSIERSVGELSQVYHSARAGEHEMITGAHAR